MANVMKQMRGTALEWADLNPILQDGQIGYEQGTGKFKIGNGKTLWNDLEYFVPDSDGVSMAEHINSLTPHPVYDEGPSLLLLYNNAKV